jgi:hypothetical protein
MTPMTKSSKAWLLCPIIVLPQLRLLLVKGVVVGGGIP